MPRNSDRQEWRTPPELFKALDSQFRFIIDAAASADNRLCPVWCGSGAPYGEDGLSADWQNNTFCNPGFSNMLAWVEKAAMEAEKFPHCDHVLIGLCAPSTKWWDLSAQTCSEIRLLSPRPQFLPPVNSDIKPSSNARENAVFIWRGLAQRQAHIWTWRWK